MTLDNILYNSLSAYYHALSKKGYMPYEDARKLLVLGFYNEFLFEDYKELLSEEDYCIIECALNCLYGSNCLLPYPDYLKDGKLNLRIEENF